jgi:acetyltransferase
MSTYRFSSVFAPGSIAVVGASETAGSLGGIVLQAIRDGGFPGAIHAVNPRRRAVFGVPCHRSLAAIGAAVDLVVVATPAHAVAGVIDDAAAAGAGAAIILTAGLGRGPGSIAEAVRLKARECGLRLVGPNCLGVLSPRTRLNASFARRLPMEGSLALISQSGAIAAGLVEWAWQRRIGFSGIVSIGDAVDIDFGDCLDHFAEDPGTKAILLYVEGLTDAPKFITAARKAARIKPVVVIKAGRHAEGARAAATHTGALAGSDAVYDAAFQRAGCLRVMGLDELFAVAETLATQEPIAGDRLAVLTNGGGLGVLAVDRLMDFGGRLATLSDATLAALDRALPPTWSKANPVDIIGDAPAERYKAALDALLEDDGCDAVLVMNCPTAVTSSAEAASAVIASARAHRTARGRRKPVFSVWMGGDQALRATFESDGIASFESEVDAVRGISHLMRLHGQQQALLAAPAPQPSAIHPDRDKAAQAIRGALADGRTWLNPVEVADVLEAYGVAAPQAMLAATAPQAAAVARGMLTQAAGLAVKIQSRDIVHKSDVDGVRLGLATPEAAAAAATDIMERARRLRPNARIEGVTIQPMIQRTHARELIVGMTVDPTFGPVLLFGHGGTAVEVIDDKALALLPLDFDQARKLIAETRVSRLLAGYRNIPAADRDSVAMVLVRVSRLVEDNPEIVGLDLNPVLADATDAIAIDARIQVADIGDADRDHVSETRFAIRPYPRHLERTFVSSGGVSIDVRPLRPTDDRALMEMLQRCTPEDVRHRFFGVARATDRRLIARLTQLDYAREMAFVAIDPDSRDIIAVVRLHGDSNHDTAEFAILVRSDRQELGVGHGLMTMIIDFARKERYREIFGHILGDNNKIAALCASLGFTSQSVSGGTGETIVRLPIAA